LHFRTERHANVRLAVFIDMQINANCVCAIFVFANVDKLEFFIFTRLLLFRVIRIGNECLAPLVFRERLEQVDDFVELCRVHREREFTADYADLKL
jgi:hypothetical protein